MNRDNPLRTHGGGFAKQGPVGCCGDKPRRKPLVEDVQVGEVQRPSEEMLALVDKLRGIKR